MTESSDSTAAGDQPLDEDCRLYVPDADSWKAAVMRGSERHYCYAKSPGQDYFHLIVPGEIYVQHGDEKLCLMCAVRQGVLTTNRLFWNSYVKQRVLEE